MAKKLDVRQLAEYLDRATEHWCKEAAAELRRLAAVEQERDELKRQRRNWLDTDITAATLREQEREITELERQSKDLRAKCQELSGVVAHLKDLIAMADDRLCIQDAVIKAALDVPGVREMLAGVLERAAIEQEQGK